MLLLQSWLQVIVGLSAIYLLVGKSHTDSPRDFEQDQLAWISAVY